MSLLRCAKCGAIIYAWEDTYKAPDGEYVCKECYEDQLKEAVMFDEKLIIRTALHGYGAELQSWKFIEEIGELITAFARKKQAEINPALKRGGEVMNLTEEFADVGIMSDQMIELFNLAEDVKGIRNMKLERLMRRLNMGEEE